MGKIYDNVERALKILDILIRYRFMNKRKIYAKTKITDKQIKDIIAVFEKIGVVTITKINNREHRINITNYGRDYFKELKEVKENYERYNTFLT